MRYPHLLLAAAFLLHACTKERDVQTVQYGNDSIDIRINEYSAASPQAQNEFGMEADWIELYNAGADTFRVAKERWFITDNINHKGNYALPAVVVPPGRFLVIWCDDSDTVAAAIHTNFKLSTGGEDIGVFMLSGLDTVPLDIRQFGAQLPGKSEGRKPDGSSSWTFFNTPTPGGSNQ
ncbi:MAG TPA: lamin tail domain-containing protein [Chitinophagales bacterium]|nr:lamin tail domain-containing protein [Chitinophagales bacterium]